MWKKQRGGKRKESSYDARKFVNADAEEHYEHTILHKTIIAERGFSNPGGSVEDQIVNRCWQPFTTSPSSACVSLVREFYSNAIARKADGTIFVRGKWVSFKSETINQIYNLESFEFDQYTTFRTSPIDFDDILKFLCGGEEKVQWRRKGNQVSNFPSSGLDSESKAWHYFITARLLPSGNTSEVTRERALLNYAIQNGYTIDVGKIISQSLLHVFQANTPVALGHPSVIHDLCMAHDVAYLPSEEMLPTKTSISKGKISSYSSRTTTEGGESSAQGRNPPSGGRFLSLADQVGHLREEVHDLSMGVKDNSKRLSLLEKIMARREKREDRRERKEEHRAEQDAIYRQYMVDYHQAEYASSHPSAGLSYPYPVAPHFSEFQEEEEPAEEEEDDGDEYED